MQRIIYHMHDVCCNHSTLTLDDAVNYSIAHGYTKIYWSEHCPVSVDCGYKHRRATFAQLTDLKKRIGQYNKKYEGKLHIYFGYEVEFNKPNRWYFEKLARDPLCEFMIMGLHFYGDIFKLPWPYDYCMNDTHSKKYIKEYLEMFKSGLESGLFSWAPHPEIFLNSWCKWDDNAQKACKEIIKIAAKTKTPLGFDINFKSPQTKSEWHYPCGKFWNLVSKTNLPIIVESDAHSLEKITVEWIKLGHKYAKQFNVEKNVVDQIPIKWFDKRPQLVLYEKGMLDKVNKTLLNDLSSKKVVFKQINSKDNLVSLCKKSKIHPVWTLCLTKNTSILAKAKKTSMFIVSDLKGSDLTFKKFRSLSYTDFIKKEFVKEI